MEGKDWMRVQPYEQSSMQGKPDTYRVTMEKKFLNRHAMRWRSNTASKYCHPSRSHCLNSAWHFEQCAGQRIAHDATSERPREMQSLGPGIGLL